MPEDGTWVKSSFCADNACVEVAKVGESIAMRDGKRPDQAPLTMRLEEWNHFLDQIVGGKFRQP